MGRFAFIVAFCLLALATGCDGYPQDPGGSLKEAKEKKLRVGIIHSPPWADLQGAQPAGEEVDIVERFAEALGTEVEWVPGSEGQLMPILSSQELHIVIGGLTQQSPWSKHVGLTDPYLTVPVVVCATDGQAPPEEIDGLEVTVKEGSAIAADVKHKGGVPITKASLQSHTGLIAVYQRQAQHYGCGDQQLKIASHKHVLAVPKGENGLLMALEEHLDAFGY